MRIYLQNYQYGSYSQLLEKLTLFMSAMLLGLPRKKVLLFTTITSARALAT
jgi:hypothetical protein